MVSKMEKKILPTVETKADDLLKLIKSHGQLSLSAAAKALALSPKQLEHWAKVLEGHGLIELIYPANPFEDIQLRLKSHG